MGLTRFDTLSLDFNQVADLTPLAGLTGLEFLSLDAQQPALAALDGLRPWWTCDG